MPMGEAWQTKTAPSMGTWCAKAPIPARPVKGKPLSPPILNGPSIS